MMNFVESDNRYLMLSNKYANDHDKLWRQLFAAKNAAGDVIYPSVQLFHKAILPLIVINGHLVSEEDALVLYNAILESCKKYFEDHIKGNTFFIPNIWSIQRAKGRDTDIFINDLSIFHKSLYNGELKTIQSNEELLSYLAFHCSLKGRDGYSIGSDQRITNKLLNQIFILDSGATLFTNLVIFYLNQQFVIFALSKDETKPTILKITSIDAYTKLL